MAGVSNLDRFEFIYSVFDLYEAGVNNRAEIARQLGVSRSSVSKVLTNYKENREQLLAREMNIWRLRQQGKTHQQIADEIGVERSTVTKTLGRLSDRILDALATEVQRAKIEQWQQLDYIVAETLAAWEGSKLPSKEVTRKQNLGDVATSSQGGSATKSEVITSTVIDEDGNIGFLREARAAMADLRHLLGLDAPLKISSTDPTGEKSVPGQVFIYIPDNGRDQDPTAAGASDEISGDSG